MSNSTLYNYTGTLSEVRGEDYDNVTANLQLGDVKRAFVNNANFRLYVNDSNETELGENTDYTLGGKDDYYTEKLGQNVYTTITLINYIGENLSCDYDVVGSYNDATTDNADIAHRAASSGVHGVTGDVVGHNDTQLLENKTAKDLILTSSVSGSAVLDEDDMASDSDTKIATQQSIKKYVDDQIASVSAFAPQYGEFYKTASQNLTTSWADVDLLEGDTVSGVTRDVSNAERIEFAADGKYLITASVQINSSSGATSGAIILCKNTTEIKNSFARVTTPSTNHTHPCVSTVIVDVTTSDYVKLQASGETNAQILSYNGTEANPTTRNNVDITVVKIAD